MARKPRFNIPGYAQHVIQRGNNRGPSFFCAEDFRYYLQCLSDGCAKQGCAVHAYVLMTNHVHLLMTPDSAFAVSWTMQDVGRRYVSYINRRYQRSGTLWEGRFKSSLVQSGTYLLACYRYIELNPVRAQMVAHPDHYRWSSYRANAYGDEDPLVTPHAEYLRLGRSAGDRRDAYRGLFDQQFDTRTLNDVREALNRELVFGNTRFKDRIEATLNRQSRSRKRGRPTASAEGILEKNGI